MMGDGLALLDPLLFHEEIKAGRLVRPYDLWLDEGYGYYLTTHPEDLSNEAVALFRSWLIARFAAGATAVRRAGTRRGRDAEAAAAPAEPPKLLAAKCSRKFPARIGMVRCHFGARRVRAARLERLSATNRGRRRPGRARADENLGNAMTTDTPPQDTGRRRRRAAERGGASAASSPAGSAAIAFRPAGPRVPGRARFDPSGRAYGLEGDRRRLPARRCARDPQKTPAPTSIRPRGACVSIRPSSKRASASRPRNSSSIRATRRVSSRSAGVTSRSARWPARPIPSIARADAGPETSATIKTSSVSGKVSIRSISGAATRSSRSTFTPPFVISRRCSTCSRCPTSRSTLTASGASAIWTPSRW